MSEKIDREMPASRIAEKFGGTSALARAFDPPKAPSTVHRWLESGLIPAAYQGPLLEAAKAKGIKLKAEDFIPARARAA